MPESVLVIGGSFTGLAAAKALLDSNKKSRMVEVTLVCLPALQVSAVICLTFIILQRMAASATCLPTIGTCITAVITHAGCLQLQYATITTAILLQLKLPPEHDAKLAL
jgi:2-polyprenyl-6-methoxyphenol hydroxylase-like FAD-dependent oxidoreductase